MQLYFIIPALLALAGVGTAAPISPAPCPDVSPNPNSSVLYLLQIPNQTNSDSQLKVDLILNGELPAEVCCSYGICKGDVVIAMG
jgi:hypothetical protein